MDPNTWFRSGCLCFVLIVWAGPSNGDDNTSAPPKNTSQKNITQKTTTQKTTTQKTSTQPTTIKLGSKGNVTLSAPAKWKQGKPRFRMIDYEFAAPAAKKGEEGARVTIMGAGGDVQTNLKRWEGQFNAQGRTFSTEKLKIAGQEVHVVDIGGTFMDRPGGPMAGGKVIARPDYRVLAAILVTSQGRYYVKMVGPQATVKTHEKGFRAMLNGLQVK